MNPSSFGSMSRYTSVSASHSSYGPPEQLPNMPSSQPLMSPMSKAPRFKAAFPYQKDVLALPVGDLDAASQWYSANFGMAEVERRQDPSPTVVLERDGTRIGFS